MKPIIPSGNVRITAPQGGSAWRHYGSKDVLGVAGSAGLIGIFASSAPDHTKDKDLEEAEAQETRARIFGLLRWNIERVPAPDFAVLVDELGPSFRAELSIFLQGTRRREDLKEVRFLGPRRVTIQEARKDGCELRRAAFRCAPKDPTLGEVRRRLKELQFLQWSLPDLAEDEDAKETWERQLPELDTATQAKRGQFTSTTEWFHAHSKKEPTQNFEPVGASWALAQPQSPVPCLPGVWYMHERQNQDGKHFPWLFFNASIGRYYRSRAAEAGALGSRWVQTGTPNLPENQAVTIAHGSACLPTASGRKDDLTVLLPELALTGRALKHPLPFMDKPASMFLLVHGHRGTSAAAEFCAKRFHTHFLPRLSAFHYEPEDYELVAMVNESIETLDQTLLESGARYAGCSMALTLVLGSRVLVCTLGACRALLCTPASENDPKKGIAASKQSSTPSGWRVRPLLGGATGRSYAEVAELERNRRLEAYAPLDYFGRPDDRLSAMSPSTDELTAANLSEKDRAIRRVLRAAHPFAALGFSAAEAQAAAPSAGRQAFEAFEAIVGPPDGRPQTELARSRVKAAADLVDKLLSLDPFGAQRIAELYYVMDEEEGIVPPRRAATLLGVEPGCGEAAAQASVEFRYRAVFTQLQSVSPEQSAKAWAILGEVVDAAARPTTPLWTPPLGARAVSEGRALGFRDLKRPRRLVGIETVSEVIHLEPGSNCCVMLLTGSASSLTDVQIASAVSAHKGRAKAACLRLANEAYAVHQQRYEKEAARARFEALAGMSDASSSNVAEVPAVGALAAFISVATQADSAATSSSSSQAQQADAKKRKLGNEKAAPQAAKATKIRASHLLLKCAPSAVVSSTPDPQARRPAPEGRTQVDAERELLRLLEVLDAEISKLPAGPEATKRLTAKFAELCKEHSDCKSALSGSLSDLGWVVPGQLGKEFDAASFDLPVGGLSDIFVSPRGVHIVLRLA